MFGIINPIFHDENAADALPMRITVAAILFSIIILISSTAISDMVSDSHEYEAEIEVSRILAHARHMAFKGSGSKVTIEVDIPSDTTIVLGSLPDREDAWPQDANNYYIQIGTRNAIYQTDAFFSNID